MEEINNNSFENNENNKLTEHKKESKNFINFIKRFLSKEVILYVVFGGLTTLVNIGSFYIMTTFFGVNNTSANNIAIVLAVLVAYFTNKDLVFHSQANGFGEKFIEFSKFILGRLLTMFIESIGGSLLFTYVTAIPTIVSKCLITIIVIILNFFISKFFAFKSNKIEEKWFIIAINIYIIIFGGY